MSEKSEILDAMWFTGTQCIGIVKTKNAVGQIKVYIGVATGINEKLDARHIADWGVPVAARGLRMFLKEASDVKRG